METRKRDKLAFFLPNSFTAMNMGCGFAAILFAIQGHFLNACFAIFLGAIFDMVDGRVARLTGTESAFGEQFDSMSDLISFGLAPALIFYYRFLVPYNRAGMVMAFFFVLCGALRLARFNASIEKVSSDYFQGLPIPGAAIGVLSYVLISLSYESFLSAAYICIPYLGFYAILMISNIPFPSFKNSAWAKKHRRYTFFILISLTLSVVIYIELMVPILISVYVVGSLIYVLLNRKKFKGFFNWDETEE